MVDDLEMTLVPSIVLEGGHKDGGQLMVLLDRTSSACLSYRWIMQSP